MKRISFVFAILVFFTQLLYSAEGGYSNYIPGTYGDFGMAVRPSEGLTIRNDVYYYNANDTRGMRNGSSADMDLTIKMNLFTMMYMTDKEFFGGGYAFGALIPFTDLEVDGNLNMTNMGRYGFSDDASDLGDITLIPGILFWQKGNFHFSLAEYIVVPTADYDPEAAANPGLNYYTFDTNFAVTYLNEKTGQDYSVNIGHLYNTENKDTDYKTGQDIHVDLVLNQFLSESLALGIHGFYLRQITGDQIEDSFSNRILGDNKAEAAGVGPAVMWGTKIMGQDVAFITKWIHEFTAENRIKGEHLMLSFATTF